MAECTCKNEDRIRDLEQRVSIVETKVDDIKADLKDIKEFQSKIIFWLIGTLTSSLVTLGVILIK